MSLQHAYIVYITYIFVRDSVTFPPRTEAVCGTRVTMSVVRRSVFLSSVRHLSDTTKARRLFPVPTSFDMFCSFRTVFGCFSPLFAKRNLFALSQELLDRSMEQVKRNLEQQGVGGSGSGGSTEEESFEKQRQMLENELMRVSTQLEMSQKVGCCY